MQPNEPPIESRFGEAVLDNRRVQGLSQKALADLLTGRGLALDASAISRIEKGTRAIRLSEAANIADVLGFSLSNIEHPRDPHDDIARLKKSVDAGISATREGAYQVAAALEEMVWLLDRRPELLELLREESDPAFEGFLQYVNSVETGWLAKNVFATSTGFAFESVEIREAVTALIRTAAISAVASGINAREDWWDAPKGGSDVEHQETP